jgi:alkanesulfonate monooxygenase SsuD/methylene tetrahydromethanopterin reductase-like flavin-dependent oxidoreductase (luciferase family)
VTIVQLGVVFPQTEIGEDPAGLAAYAKAAQELGYQHLLAYDHVVGADTSVRPRWAGPYTSESSFHEPFVLFGYLAGVVPGMELVTGVIILPQRQTVLAAKQAA